jgi:hypothetical protein
MKVGPKVPGPVDPSAMDGGTPGESADPAEAGERVRFSDVLATAASAECDPPSEAAAARVAAVASRCAAGEITPGDAAREIAAATVEAWPADLAPLELRERIVREVVETLEADPTFRALIGAAAEPAG